MGKKKGMTRPDRISARVDSSTKQDLEYNSNLLNITISDAIILNNLYTKCNSNEQQLKEFYKIAQEMNWL